MSKEKVYWTMRDGKKIDIDEMSISHLRNTLKMIVRQVQNVNVSGHNGEFQLNGDMAEEFNSGYVEDKYEDWEEDWYRTQSLNF